ncbi:MAG: hypothetical protein HIU91_06200 [Acidobacteria bacterium]|nr:hypothetical protein [Acidobacteriota bacterium]
MNIFIHWIKTNLSAALTIGLLAVSTVGSLIAATSARSQARSAKLQAENAERGNDAAERAASAAEQQLSEARIAIETAQKQSEAANERAEVSAKQAELAHEQMKAALAPLLVLLRIQDHFGQKFFIENQGPGLAKEITWDFMPPVKPLDPGRLFRGFNANMLAPNAREEFSFSYDMFQQTGMMFRYVSRDGRVFWSHIGLVINGNHAFRHDHLS